MNAATKITTVKVTHNNKQYRIKCVAKCDMPEYGIVQGECFYLVREKANTYSIKKITVISREYTNAGDVICRSINGDGKEYITT